MDVAVGVEEDGIVATTIVSGLPLVPRVIEVNTAWPAWTVVCCVTVETWVPIMRTPFDVEVNPGVFPCKY